MTQGERKTPYQRRTPVDEEELWREKLNLVPRVQVDVELAIEELRLELPEDQLREVRGEVDVVVLRFQAELREAVVDGGGVVVRDSDDHSGEVGARLGCEPTALAVIDEPEASIRQQQDVPRVRVAVEELAIENLEAVHLEQLP